MPPPPPVFSNDQEASPSTNDDTLPATSVMKNNRRTPSSNVSSPNNGNHRSSSTSAVVSEAAQGDTDAAVAVALLAYLAFDSAASPSAAAFCTAKTILPNNNNDQRNNTNSFSARSNNKKKNKKKKKTTSHMSGQGVDDGGGSRSDRATGSSTNRNIGEAPEAASHLAPRISMVEAEVTDTVDHDTDLYPSLTDEDDVGEEEEDDDDDDLDDDDHTVLAPLSPTSIRAAMSDVDTVTSFLDHSGGGGGAGGLGESALGGKENGGASRGSLSLFLLSNSKTSLSSNAKQKKQTVSKGNRKNLRSGSSSLFTSSGRKSFSAHSISEEGEEIEDEDDDCSLCAVVGHPASSSDDNNIDNGDPSCNEDEDEEGSSQAAAEVLTEKGHAAVREGLHQEGQTSGATTSITAQPPLAIRTSLSMLLEQQHYSPRTRVRKSTMNLDDIHDAEREDCEDETEEESENESEQIICKSEKDKAWNQDDDVGSNAESWSSRQNVAVLQAKATTAAIVTADESKAKSDGQDKTKPAEGEVALVRDSPIKIQKDDSARLEEMTSGGLSVMSQSRGVSEAKVAVESFSESNARQKLQPSQCSNVAAAVSQVASISEARESILPAQAHDNKVTALENATPPTLQGISTDTSFSPLLSLAGPGPRILAADAPPTSKADEVEAGGASSSFAVGPVAVESRAAALCLSEDGTIDNVRSTLSPPPHSELSAAKSMTLNHGRLAGPPTNPMTEVADVAISADDAQSTASAPASVHERLQNPATTASRSQTARHEESRLESSKTTNLHLEALCEGGVSEGVDASTVTEKTPPSGDIHDSWSADRATEIVDPSAIIEHTLTKFGEPALSSQREEKKDEGRIAAESFQRHSDFNDDPTVERSEREARPAGHSDGPQFSDLEEGDGPSAPKESLGAIRDTAVSADHLSSTNDASLNGKVEQSGNSASPLLEIQGGEKSLCAEVSDSSSALSETKLDKDTNGAPIPESQLSGEKGGRSQENSRSALKDGQEAANTGNSSDVVPYGNTPSGSESKNEVGTLASDSSNSQFDATLTPSEPSATAKSTVATAAAAVPSPSEAAPSSTAPATPTGQPANSAGAASANRFAVVSLSFLAPNLSPKKACDCIEEAVRILKPGGRLYVVDWDGRTVSKLPDWARNWLKPVASGDDANLQKQYEHETQQILNRMGRRNYEETATITRWIGSLSY